MNLRRCGPLDGDDPSPRNLSVVFDPQIDRATLRHVWHILTQIPTLRSLTLDFRSLPWAVMRRMTASRLFPLRATVIPLHTLCIQSLCPMNLRQLLPALQGLLGVRTLVLDGPFYGCPTMSQPLRLDMLAVTASSRISTWLGRCLLPAVSHTLTVLSLMCCTDDPTRASLSPPPLADGKRYAIIGVPDTFASLPLLTRCVTLYLEVVVVVANDELPTWRVPTIPSVSGVHCQMRFEKPQWMMFWGTMHRFTAVLLHPLIVFGARVCIHYTPCVPLCESYRVGPLTTTNSEALAYTINYIWYANAFTPQPATTTKTKEENHESRRRDP